MRGTGLGKDVQVQLRVWSLMGAGLLASCGAPRSDRVTVDTAWVRLPAVPGRPGAAYFTIRGGAAPTKLLSVSADIAIQTELHESMANGMRPSGDVPIPARADVPFQPGGRHAMLFDVNRGVKPGRLIELTLTFADGTRLLRRAEAVAANAPPPGN
jgi:periplasmic copper chaperone A